MLFLPHLSYPQVGQGLGFGVRVSWLGLAWAQLQIILHARNSLQKTNGCWNNSGRFKKTETEQHLDY